MRKLLLMSMLFIAPFGASARSPSEIVGHVGEHYGRAEAFVEACKSLKFSPSHLENVRKTQKLNPLVFDRGRRKGRQVTHGALQAIGTSPASEREAMACILAMSFYGPFGREVSGFLVDDDRARAAQMEAAKAKETVALRRVDMPAPSGARELDLIVDPGEGPDKLTGRHKLRVQKLSGMIVGCVPCFNSMTYIVIADGVPYAANGGTIPRLGRYRVVIDGVAKPVRDINTRPGLDAIGAIRAIPGCDFAGPNYLDRLFKAVTQGQCLGN